jgi:hypothetical protein
MRRAGIAVVVVLATVPVALATAGPVQAIVPSSEVVTPQPAAPDGVAGDGLCSLREAVDVVNLNNVPAGDSDCQFHQSRALGSSVRHLLADAFRRGGELERDR